MPLSRITAGVRGGTGYDVRAMNEVAIRAKNVHEYKVMSLLATSGNYTTTSDPGNFNTTGTSLVSPVQAAIDDAEGLIHHNLNTMVINPDVARILGLNDEVVAWNGQRYNVTGVPATRSLLADFVKEMFGLELHIARTQYTTAAGVRGYMFGDHIAFYRTGTDGLPSFVNTYLNRWMTDGLPLFSARQYESEDPRGIVYEAEGFYKVQSDNADAGCLLVDVLS